MSKDLVVRHLRRSRAALEPVDPRNEVVRVSETQVVSDLAEQGERLRSDVFGLADDLRRVREQSQLEPCDPPVHPSGGIRACLQFAHPPELILGWPCAFKRADQLDE